ncbi:hypothetical protein ACFTS5_11020 [Nocardia sp. NPDC056952]|uniref:hypothetical protein n=1 Tax=Nocardia sp. NPDC056952 TaxID=3345979 RepID=UPI00362CC60E
MTDELSTTESLAGLPPEVSAFREHFVAGRADFAEASIRDHAKDIASRLTVFDNPFIAGVVDDFFPPDLYDRLVSNWPATKDIPSVDLSAVARNYSVSERRGLRLDQADDTRSASFSGGPWPAVRAFFESPTLVSGLVTRFAGEIQDQIATLDGRSGDPEYKLWLNYDAGSLEALGAHVDHPRKLLTIVVYIGLDGAIDKSSPQRWGTSLYDVGNESIEALEFSPNAQRSAARTVEFERNRAFIMPNSRRALHGVAGGQPGVGRATLMCGYWLASLPQQ